MKIPDNLEEEIEEVMESGKIEELTAVSNKIGVSEYKADLLDELDISLYTLNSAMDKDPSLWIEYDSDEYYYYTDIQATIYGRVSKICREFVDADYPDSYGDFTGLTFWGIADEDTWLSKYSDYRLNRIDYPLLFDAVTREKKLSYEMFTDF